MLKRWRVYVLAVFFLLVGVFNLVRVGMAVYVAPILEGWSLSVPLPLLGGLYFVWGVLFIGSALWMWAKPGRERIAWPLALAYQGTVWALHLFAYQSTYARSLWARDALLTLLFLAVVVILGVKRDMSNVKRQT